MYLDEDLTTEFLAQIEGGVYSDEAQSEMAEREGGGSVRAGTKAIGADLTRTRSTQETSSRTVQQKAEGQFSRLAEHLETEEAVQPLEAFDDEIWEQLRRGEPFEVETKLEVPAMLRLASMLEGFEAFAEVLKVAGGEGLNLDEDAAEGLAMVGALRSMLSEQPVFARPVGAATYCFIAPLKPASLRVGFDELEGEATLYATIDKKLAKGETWSLLDVMGLGGLPRSARREVEKNLKVAGDLKGFGVDGVVRAPAAVVSPIAIFR
jgi:hypothetical protein